MEYSKKQQLDSSSMPAVYDATVGSLARLGPGHPAIAYAQALGLRLDLGHICLYHGRPWITIDGWYWLLRQRYPYAWLPTRPLTADERRDALLDDQTHAWRAEVWEEYLGHHLSVGHGYAREGDTPLARGSAVEPVWPWRLAEKRAEEDAIRKALNLGPPPGAPENQGYISID